VWLTRSSHVRRGTLSELGTPPVRKVYYAHSAHGNAGAAPAEESTFTTLAADLVAVLRSLVPTGPIVLLGHSLGGMVVMELARQCPEYFDGDRVRGRSEERRVGKEGRCGGWGGVAE